MTDNKISLSQAIETILAHKETRIETNSDGDEIISVWTLGDRYHEAWVDQLLNSYFGYLFRDEKKVGGLFTFRIHKKEMEENRDAAWFVLIMKPALDPIAPFINMDKPLVADGNGIRYQHNATHEMNIKAKALLTELMAMAGGRNELIAILEEIEIAVYDFADDPNNHQVIELAVKVVDEKITWN